MKFKKLLIISYLCFQLINLGNSSARSFYEQECEEESNNLKNDYFYSYSPSNISLHNNMNFKNKTSLDIEEITKVINPGVVQKEFIYKETLYTFNINSFNYKKENDLLIHFYPLNCHIKIVGQNDEKRNIN